MDRDTKEVIDDETDPQRLGHVERCAEMPGAPRNVKITFFFGPPEKPDEAATAAAVTGEGEPSHSAGTPALVTCRRVKLGMVCMRDLHAYCQCLHFDEEECLCFPVSPAEEW